jgi:hypothetical protein
MLRKIKQYEVLQVSDLERLIKLVNEGIDKGWEPVGRLMYDKKYYMQKMIKYGALECDHRFESLMKADNVLVASCMNCGHERASYNPWKPAIDASRNKE